MGILNIFSRNKVERLNSEIIVLLAESMATEYLSNDNEGSYKLSCTDLINSAILEYTKLMKDSPELNSLCSKQIIVLKKLLGGKVEFDEAIETLLINVELESKKFSSTSRGYKQIIASLLALSLSANALLIKETRSLAEDHFENRAAVIKLQGESASLQKQQELTSKQFQLLEKLHLDETETLRQEIENLNKLFRNQTDDTLKQIMSLRRGLSKLRIKANRRQRGKIDKLILELNESEKQQKKIISSKLGEKILGDLKSQMDESLLEKILLSVQINPGISFDEKSLPNVTYHNSGDFFKLASSYNGAGPEDLIPNSYPTTPGSSNYLSNELGIFGYGKVFSSGDGSVRVLVFFKQGTSEKEMEKIRSIINSFDPSAN